jgi:FKBP-type peptidyl-prolyl cis-trans isomerase
MKATLLLLTLVFAVVSSTRAEDKPAASKPAEDKPAAADPAIKDKVSYFIGTQIGHDFQRNGIELNMDIFVEAIKDALAKKPSKYAEADLEAAMQQFQAEMVAKQKAQMDAASGNNTAEGEKFLAENGKREGVTTTASGLQYEVLKKADGPKPTAADTVTVHYRGTLINGKEFDISYSRNEPTIFPLNGVITGWTEGLQLMNVGSKFKFFVPSKLAYADRGAGSDIGPNATLIFEVELLSIGDKK